MKTRIGVFFGGRSTEHEISVISANQAMAAIDRDKYEVIPVYITKQGKWYTGPLLTDVKNYRDTDTLLKGSTEVYMRPVYGDFNLYKANSGGMFASKAPAATLDVAIPVLHGSNGEDGTFEGVLETIGLPYAGCGVLASANGMDKITMKMILAANGIPVVDYVWFTDKQWFTQRDTIIGNIEERLRYPVIVKPANLGSSVGIGRADNRSVLGDADNYETSVLEEPIKSGEILSYTDKYMGGSKDNRGMHAAQKRIPAELPASETERIRFLAGETFRVLGCHGVSRVDVMVDSATRQIYVNEINTIPGSLSFYLWEACGVSFTELMDRLVHLALKRRREQEAKTVSYDQNIFAMGGGTKGGVKGIK